MKGIDIDEVFSILVKLMKKVKLEVSLTNMDLNWRAILKISSHRWAEGGDCWVHKASGSAHEEKAYIWACIIILWLAGSSIVSKLKWIRIHVLLGV